MRLCLIFYYYFESSSRATRSKCNSTRENTRHVAARSEKLEVKSANQVAIFHIYNLFFSATDQLLAP